MKFFGNYILYILIYLSLSLNVVYAQENSNNVDFLLKKAKSLFSNNPQEAVKLAKFAYSISLKNNLKIKEIKCLNFVVYYYLSNQDYKNADLYGNKGLSIINDIKIDSLAGYFWFLKGYLAHAENNYESAIKSYKNALIYYNNVRFEKKLSNTYLNIGLCEMKISHYETAVNYYFKSADLFLKLRDSLDISSNYNSIGACYLSLKNLGKALYYYKKSYYIRYKLKNYILIAQSQNNIGDAYKEFREPDSALVYLSKSVSLYKNQIDSSLLILPFQNIGDCWKIKRNLLRAERFIKRSLKIANNYSMKEELARGNLDLCEILMDEKRYARALTAVNVTEAVAAELKLPELLMQADDDKYKLYRQMGNYKEALYYETQKETLKDSIFTIAKDKAINELEIKYQTNLKERDIATLNLQNKLQSKTVAQQKFSIVVLIIGAVLLSLLFGIAYNSYLQKNKANIRIQHLMQELHHRVKNNLQIMSSLLTIQIENLSDEATKAALRENEARMASMNLIHNQLYQNNSGTQINMESYLSKLLHHIKNSFGGDREKYISLRLEVEPVMVEADKAVAIGLIVNELATNAFKYAFEGETGEIYLGLKQEGKSKILLSLGDNGKGIKKENQGKEISFGIKLVNLMARQLNSKLIFENNKGAFYRMEISL